MGQIEILTYARKKLKRMSEATTDEMTQYGEGRDVDSGESRRKRDEWWDIVKR